MKQNISEIKSFLEGYKDLSIRFGVEKFAHFKSNCDDLLSGYGIVKERIKELERKEAGNYNIFSILNIGSAETRTHTPFLRNLLDPKGTHGQGDLFLKSFVQKFIPSQKTDNFQLDDSRDYRVSEERWIGNGRVDLFISSMNHKKRFGIIVENKIYALDQWNQLKRYYDFLEKTKKLNIERMVIFYLTVDGFDPGEGSIKKEELAIWKKDKVFKNLSYRKDINNWLRDCNEEIEADRVRDLISQYLSTIKTL